MTSLWFAGDDIHVAAFLAGTADLYLELFPAGLALSWYLVMLNGALPLNR